MNFVQFAVIALVPIAALLGNVHANAKPGIRTIAVVGTGVIAAKADIAVVEFELKHKSQNAIEAKEFIGAGTGMLMKFLEEKSPDSIEVTLGLLDVRTQQQRTVGEMYHFTKRVTVETMQLDELNVILEKGMQIGFTAKWIRWKYSRAKEQRDELLKLACEDAKRKAKLVASQLGARVGQVHTIDLDYRKPVGSVIVGKSRGKSRTGPKYDGTEVNARDVKLKANVKVVYELK